MRRFKSIVKPREAPGNPNAYPDPARGLRSPWRRFAGLHRKICFEKSWKSCIGIPSGWRSGAQSRRYGNRSESIRLQEHFCKMEYLVSMIRVFIMEIFKHTIWDDVFSRTYKKIFFIIVNVLLYAICNWEIIWFEKGKQICIYGQTGTIARCLEETRCKYLIINSKSTISKKSVTQYIKWQKQKSHLRK